MSTARPRIQATPTCSLRASGAIICPKITRPPEKSDTARAAIAATTRTQSPSLLLIGLSEDCGAERTDHRRRAVSGSSCFRSPAASQYHCRALCGRPAITRGGKKIGRWRGPPLRLRALAHPPALKAHYGDLVLSIGLKLRPYGNCPLAGIPCPLMVLWDATFKEKGGGQACGHERLARRALGKSDNEDRQGREHTDPHRLIAIAGPAHLFVRVRKPPAGMRAAFEPQGPL